jgi:Zn finger protein HypA/HybF involved in hydrogenase expression
MLNNKSQLFQYSNLSFTCDKCGQELKNSKLFSSAPNKAELDNFPTYCPSCVEPSLLVPISKKKPKPKKNTVAYYQCLSACCQQGISPKKITQITHECKHNSAGILSERTSEIRKLNEAYQQIGISLTNLLQPVKE